MVRVVIMQSVEVSIDLDAPIWRVFQNWKRFEFLPTFVPAVREVRYVANNRLYWREEHGGKEHESVFEITPNLPDNSLSWRSVSGWANSGNVVFDPKADGTTQLTVCMDYEPDSASQQPAAVTKRLNSYLRGFKKFIESAPA